ncbi:hypothetical protein ACOMHN_000792 [Nucella lapillus]
MAAASASKVPDSASPGTVHDFCMSNRHPVLSPPAPSPLDTRHVHTARPPCPGLYRISRFLEFRDDLWPPSHGQADGTLPVIVWGPQLGGVPQ